MTQNYFELFAINTKFDIEFNILETNFRKIQAAVHPDRFVNGSSAEKLSAMQHATLVNEAYQTLKNPAKRAQYLLELQGITAAGETNTAMPTAFLMQQMEWREALEHGISDKNMATLDHLLEEINLKLKELQLDLTQLLDEKKDYPSALEATAKLIFMTKISENAKQAIEFLDD